MEILKHTFIIFQSIGIWRPVHWLPSWKTKLYDFYTWFIAIIVISQTISELIGLVNSFGNLAALINDAFMLLSLIADCCKAATILIKRNNLIELTNILQREPCCPRSEEELAIQHKFDRLVRSNTLCYSALVGMTTLGLLLKSLMEDIPRRTLPYNCWLPFDYQHSLLIYFFAWSHQMVTFGIGGMVASSFDTLVTGLMLQTCAQLSILKSRFHYMPVMIDETVRKMANKNDVKISIENLEKKLLRQCIKHHIEIFRFAETSNDLFSIMIFLQYSISILILCTSIFELSTMKLFEMKFIVLSVYLFCIGVQIFIYCFYGCEVTLESLAVGDAIYDIQWEYLSISSQRSLLTIMCRTLRPIQFTSGYVVTLNLENFNSLLKISYSAYNVLKTSSE